jgi:hypothetical protein
MGLRPRSALEPVLRSETQETEGACVTLAAD